MLAASLPGAGLAQTVAQAAAPSSPINLSPNPSQNTPGQTLRPAGSVPAVAANPSRVPAGGNSPVNLSPNPNQDTPGETLRSAGTLPIAPTVNSGLFPSVGNYLLGNGIDFHGVLLDHALTNPSTGNTPGNTANLGIFRPELDVDLGKLANIQGGSIHAALTYFFSKSDEPGIIAQTGGALNGYQTTPILEASTLTRLTYEQQLLNGRLDIEVGRSNVHQYFFIPNSLDPFTYDSPLLYVDQDFNSIPYGVWMGKATYKLTPAWYLQGGVFEDNYAREVRNGWNFGTNGATGAQIIGEVGYRTSFRDEAYPANLEAGFVWNTRTPNYYNVKGSGAIATPATTAAKYAGGGAFILQGAKVVWRGPDRGPGLPPMNLQLYGQLDAAVDKPQPFDLDAAAGANLTGVIPFRPADILGFQARYLRLSAVEASFETQEHTLVNRRRFAGTQDRNSYQFEASYQIQVTRYATLSLYGQYYVNPDDYEVPFVNHVPGNGFQAGTLLRIPLGPLLGTSNNPF